MSLIDEALKRAELEAARRDGLRGGPYPWIMEGQKRKRRRWAAVASVAVIIALAVGGAVWLLRKPGEVPGSRFPVAESTAAAPQSKIENPKSKMEMETVEVAPPPRAAAPQPPASAAKKTREAKPAEAEPPRAKAPAAESRPSAPVAAEARPSRGATEPKTYLGEFQVPEGGKITLEGIVWSETNPIALINGKVRPPGAVVEEFTVVSIQPDRVELKGRGTTVFLTLK